MQNIRYNPYTFIHKGIRFELAELLRTVGNFDFRDAQGGHGVARRLRESVRLMNEHARHEDAQIDPLLLAKAPHLSRRVHSAHGLLETHEAEVLRLCDAAPGNPVDGYRLYLALSRYASAQFTHMAEEETEIVAGLWRHFSDAEIIAAENAIIAGLTPQDAGEYFSWMIPGMNDVERETLLAAMRQGAPAEAVAFVEELVRAAHEAQLAA